MKKILVTLSICLFFAGCRFERGDGMATTQVVNTEANQKIELPSYSSDEDVIEYSGFTTSYNHETLIPNWVAYELTAEELEPIYTSQSSTFSMDFDVKGKQASREDYSRSGWDKGHMAPKADMRWSEKSYWESHYFTNICPQDHELNAGDWNTLEKRVRGWAREYGRVYVVCGPIVGNGSLGTIGGKKVQVPDEFFKAVVVATGKGYVAAGFIFQNNGTHHKMSEYACMVDELEKRIGRNLFAALDELGLEEAEGRMELKTLRIK
ncbi:MAG: DNA/RNA non-specific endonuclease [Bacteroidales bacterium]|nr:DNA/RNA non-specific endonuclease [Bacteroidales bacterium]